jgi:hypothetical protein
MAERSDGNYEERAALYYPYIHIRSENWLKSALLAFQKVHRIVPYVFTLADDEIIQPYAALKGADGRPLLDQAPIQTQRVMNAQDYLYRKLREHAPDLIERYAEDRTPDEFRSGERAFQLHRLKILDPNFSEWLVKNRLAWNTRAFQEHDVFNWLTMHPILGSAIMSILALAVAKQEGLNVVTPSRRAHQTLLATTHEAVLARLLDLPTSPDDDQGEHVAVQELCQAVLMTGLDLTRLTPEDIRDMILKGGRDLQKFYGKLSSLAANIPADVDETERARCRLRPRKSSTSGAGAQRNCRSYRRHSRERRVRKDWRRRSRLLKMRSLRTHLSISLEVFLASRSPLL